MPVSSINTNNATEAQTLGAGPSNNAGLASVGNQPTVSRFSKAKLHVSTIASKFLIRVGDAFSSHSFTARHTKMLAQAVHTGNNELISKLLTYTKANVNVSLHYSMPAGGEQLFDQFLITEAIDNNNIDAVRMLLPKTTNTKALKKALDHAAEQGNLEALSLLIQSQNVQLASWSPPAVRSAMSIAATNNQFQAVEYLYNSHLAFQGNADAIITTMKRIISNVVLNGNTRILKLFISKENFPRQQALSPELAIRAALSSQWDMLELLIKQPEMYVNGLPPLDHSSVPHRIATQEISERLLTLVQIGALPFNVSQVIYQKPEIIAADLREKLNIVFQSKPYVNLPNELKVNLLIDNGIAEQLFPNVIHADVMFNAVVDFVQEVQESLVSKQQVRALFSSDSFLSGLTDDLKLQFIVDQGYAHRMFPHLPNEVILAQARTFLEST